jgi:hypothetical protein
MRVSVFVLEYTVNGKRTVWPESLQAKTAFGVAKRLAAGGYKPTVFKLELSRKDIKRHGCKAMS